MVIVLVSFLVVGGLVAVGVVLLPDPAPETVTYYACLRNNRSIWLGTALPESCPSGTNLVQADMKVVDPDHSIGHRLTVFLRRWLSIPGVMAVLVVASLFWVLAGLRLRGWLFMWWLLVPPLAFVAAVCVAGPGRWFPKEPWEGPSVISLGTGDAITVLDLVGLAIGAVTVALAIRLATLRWHNRLD